jgi:vacuolar-type H+-ATPase subunit H
MTESYGTGLSGGVPADGTGSTTQGTSGSTTEAAKEQAGAVGSEARQAGQQVASVAKDEARHLTTEAGQQTKQLWQQTRSELVDQTAQQQQRLASGLRSLGDELGQMAGSSQQSGVASDLAQQASQQVASVADWLENRDPGSLVNEVRRLARNKPGMFLAAAAGLGLAGGRLSRGLVAEHQEQQAQQDDQLPPATATGTAAYPAVSPTGTMGAGSGQTAGSTGYATGAVPAAGSARTTGYASGTSGYPAGSGYPAAAPAPTGEPAPIDHTTSGGFSAYGSSTDTPHYTSTGSAPVTEGTTDEGDEGR